MERDPLTSILLDNIIIEEYTERHPIIGFFICLAMVILILMAFL